MCGFGGIGEAIGGAISGVTNAISDAGSWIDDNVTPNAATIGNMIPGPWTPFTAAYSAGRALDNGDPLGAIISAFGGYNSLSGGGGGLSSLFGGDTGGGITGSLTDTTTPAFGDYGGGVSLGSSGGINPNTYQTFSEMAAPSGDIVGGLKAPSFSGMEDIGGLGKGITGSLSSFMPGESSGIMSGAMGSLGNIFNGAANWATKNPMQALKAGSSLYSLFNQPKAPDYSKLYAGMNQQQQVRRPEHRRYYA